MSNTKPANAFSPNYISEIVPFRPALYKRPVPVQPLYNLTDNIAPNEKGKRARLLKTNI